MNPMYVVRAAVLLVVGSLATPIIVAGFYPWATAETAGNIAWAITLVFLASVAGCVLVSRAIHSHPMKLAYVVRAALVLVVVGLLIAPIALAKFAPGSTAQTIAGNIAWAITLILFASASVLTLRARAARSHARLLADDPLTNLQKIAEYREQTNKERSEGHE